MQASARLSSIAAFRKVVAGVSSATTRSCYRTSRGKAHAAPQPAQEPPPKGRKRISKQERRARIVEFVENYRASNEGKFPTMTNTHLQIGGSRHTVREVLQEMKYKHAKLPLGDDKDDPLQRTNEVTVQDKPDPEEDPLQRTDEVTVQDKPDPEEDPLQRTDEITVQDKPDPENQQREIEANKSLDANASDESGSVNEAKIHAREDNQKLEESVRTGLLGSLKSFAYGIRNFWKNM